MKRVHLQIVPALLLALLLGLGPAAALAATCDLDGDGDVDRDDISIVLARRNTSAEPGDPADIDGDGRITVLDARKCVLQCTLPRCAVVTGPADSDGDGVPDDQDQCPGYDDGVDVDQDGIPDGCDELVDSDGDGVADADDLCPGYDDTIDVDQDGIPDGCDELIDSDGDGVADADDVCPGYDDNVDLDEDGVPDGCDGTVGYQISGAVLGGGSPLPGAGVEIGPSSVSTSTGADGSFSAHVMPSEWVDDGFGGKVFPIQVTAPGFAAGYAKVPVVPGQDEYTGVQVILIPVSDGIDDQDVTDGVSDTIEKAGGTVGEVDIPPGALPGGVESVTGTVTYIDPTEPDEMAAFPGGDFLAAPEGGGQPVMLESLGLMEFDLRDQNGNPITDLAEGQAATVCMKVPEGLPAVAGETIPLWYYDPDTGLWVEDGLGTVEDRGSDGLWICGQVSHFTWWNYDRPVTTHACFKFRMIDETTGEPFTDGRTWYAEGVTYNGTSPKRPCACDSDDPGPCPLAPVSSFTVKKTTDTEHPERIRVYTWVSGTKYYLASDGDGTYSLTTGSAGAATFENPSAQGSCLYDQDVENCELLDQHDPVQDGVLLVGALNHAPRITGFTVDPESLFPGETSALTAEITDPEGDGFSVSWTADCGPDALPGISPAGQDGDVFSATFAVPASLPEGTLFLYCQVKVTATDDDGATSRAWRTVTVHGELPACEISGTVYGPEGEPLENAVVTLRSDGEDEYERVVTTGFDGTYVFDDVPCCDPETGFEFWGQLTVEFSHGGVDWTYREDVWSGCPQGEEGWEPGPILLRPFEPGPDGLAGYVDRLLAGPVAQAAGAGGPAGGGCAHDIHLPVLWGTLSVGYAGSGPCPPGPGTWLHVESYGRGEVGAGELRGDTPPGFVTPPSYAVQAPVGYGSISTACDGYEEGWNWADYELLYRGQTLSVDVGDGVAGSITGTVYGADGDPVGEGVDVELDPWGGTPAAATTTDGSGGYSFSAVPGGWHDVRADQVSVGGWLTAQGQNLVVDIRGTGCIVTGTVYDSYGAAVAGARVTLDDRAPVTTEDDGTFEITDVVTGGHQLWVSWADEASGTSGWGYRDFVVTEAGSTVQVDLEMMTWDPFGECGGPQ